MPTYTYSTAGDASLFFEVPDPDTNAAPPRAAAGTKLSVYDPDTGQALEPLVLQAGGYVGTPNVQTYPVPKIQVEADGARYTIYSQEWLATRAEGGACHGWSWQNVPADKGLLLPGDMIRFDTGVEARWDGTQWVTVAVSGGGTGGVIVTPPPTTGGGGTPTDPGTTPGGGGTTPTDPGTGTAPTQGTFPYTTTFDSSAEVVNNQYRSSRNTVSGGVLTVTGDGGSHVELAPVTVGQTLLATATVIPGGSGSATMFIASYLGDPSSGGTFIGSQDVAVSGGTITLSATVLPGADRVIVGFNGGGNSQWQIDKLDVKITADAPPPTTGGTTPTDPGTTTPVVNGTLALTGLVPLPAINPVNRRVDGSNVPLDGNSNNYVQRFIASCMSTGPKGMNLNVDQYNCVMYTANRNTPRKNVAYGGQWYSSEWENFSHNVPIDPAWTAANGTDGHIAIYLPESEGGGYGGTIWEWHVFRNGAQPIANHGGKIQDLGKSTGFYNYPWGVSASGVVFPAVAITLREMRAGRIDHAVYIGAQMSKPGHVWPATRDDGWSGADPWDVLEGQRWRLDPSVNVDTLPMSKAGKIIARAIQQYGMIFCDKTGWDNSLCTESGHAEMLAKGTSTDPWYALLEGQNSWDVMDGFPLDKLQVVKPDYGKAEVDAFLAGTYTPPATTTPPTTTTPPPTTTDPSTPYTPPPTTTGLKYTGAIPLAPVNPLNIRVDGSGVPLDPNSGAYVQHLKQLTESKGYGHIGINLYQYNCHTWVANRATPRKNVTYDGKYPDSWDRNISTNVPIDPSWHGSSGTDGHIAIYLPESEGGGVGGTLWEFHVFRNGTNPLCAHGGKITNIANSDGRYSWPWGVSASGLAMPAMAPTIAELRGDVEINHAIYLGLNKVKALDRYGVEDYWWPATRRDGVSPYDTWDAEEGMRFRLDPNVNVDSLPLNAVAKRIARAVQKYGFIIADQTFDINTLSPEGIEPYKAANGGVDPYATIMSGIDPWKLMAGFPMDRLQLVREDYGRTAVEDWQKSGQKNGA